MRSAHLPSGMLFVRSERRSGRITVYAAAQSHASTGMKEFLLILVKNELAKVSSRS